MKILRGVFIILLVIGVFFACDSGTGNPETPPAPSVSISGGETVLLDTDLPFTATASNLNGAAPAYQWQVDGVDESGETDTSYTFSRSSVGDYEVTCVMTVNGAAYTSNTVTVTADYGIGSTGPGGGVVFYDDTIGYDFDEDGTVQDDEKNLMVSNRFLEAAPSGWDNGNAEDPGLPWGAHGTDITALDDVTGADSDADALADTVGKGKANTTAIVTQLTTDSETGKAAQSADGYEDANDMDDWFLPSIGELELLSSEKDTVGGISSSYYWSSSEGSSNSTTHAWRKSMSHGAISEDVKNNGPRVRPVRAF